MTEPLSDTRTGATFGEVVPLRSHSTSAIEKQVRGFLREAGYPVAKRGVLCHHPDEGKKFLTLTPDAVIEECRLAIEVDPCTPVRFHGSSHHTENEFEKDRIRNSLLGAVGWTVLRLRLGATEGMHIGDRDVVVESSSFTKAAQAALLEAIEDFRADRAPRVRVVTKAASPRPAKRRSHVVNIGEYKYSDDGHLFNWHPTLEADKITLRLCMNGRYLYTHGRSAFFIAEIRPARGPPRRMAGAPHRVSARPRTRVPRHHQVAVGRHHPRHRSGPDRRGHPGALRAREAHP